jgi:hypothetical protein
MSEMSTLEQIQLDPVIGEPKFAHYAEAVSTTQGYVLGTPVEALCGKVFVPSRDPKKFPVCPICKEIAEAVFLDLE